MVVRQGKSHLCMNWCMLAHVTYMEERAMGIDLGKAQGPKEAACQDAAALMLDEVKYNELS